MTNEKEALSVTGYELVKDMGEDGEATFYYGYDPRTSLSGDIYKEVNELVRREDVEALIKEVVGDLFSECLKSEAYELRNGADREEVAEQLDYYAEKFEEELLDEVQNND